MKKSVILVFAFMLLALSSFAAQMQSESYKQSVIVSEGGDTTTSSSYKNSIATGIINSVVSSSSYINRLRFFHTLMLADGQFCTSAAQCEGGFCCSSSPMLNAFPLKDDRGVLLGGVVIIQDIAFIKGWNEFPAHSCC